MTVWSLEAVCTGTAVSFRGEEQSAFAKRPVAGAVHLHATGLQGDEQADKKHHGGPDMALHLYPADHHDFWNNELGGHDLLAQPGAFGSNLFIRDINENSVQIGDRFALGGALIEVSQPRQPCWKIEHRFGRKGMVAKIIETGRSGWYFRVIEEGQIAAHDRLERVSAGHDGWTVAKAFQTLFGAESSRDDLLALAALDRLSQDQKDRASKRAG
jgi:MOSC domain-containing protein YiiM